MDSKEKEHGLTPRQIRAGESALRKLESLRKRIQKDREANNQETSSNPYRKNSKESQMVKVYGLGGLKEHGKDAFAEALKNEAKQKGLNYSVVGMSDSLLDCLKVLNPYIDDKGTRLNDELDRGENYVAIKKNFPEFRRLLMNFGTEVVRNMIGENTWVDFVERKILDAKSDPSCDGIIITGIRYPNELLMLKRHDSLNLWVKRPSHATTHYNDHSSENSLDENSFDSIILNDGDLTSLTEKASKIINEVI